MAYRGILVVRGNGPGYKPEEQLFNGDSREEVRGDLALFLKAGALAPGDADDYSGV